MFLGEEFVDKNLVKTIKNKVLAKKTELEKTLGHADIEIPKSLLSENDIDQIENLHEQLLEREEERYNTEYKMKRGGMGYDTATRVKYISYFPQVKLWSAEVPRNKKSTVKTRTAYFFTEQEAIKQAVVTHYCSTKPTFKTFA